MLSDVFTHIEHQHRTLRDQKRCALTDGAILHRCHFPRRCDDPGRSRERGNRGNRGDRGDRGNRGNGETQGQDQECVNESSATGYRGAPAGTRSITLSGVRVTLQRRRSRRMRVAVGQTDGVAIS